MNSPPPAVGLGRAQDRLDELLGFLAQRAASELSSHDGLCCQTAREWFLSMSQAAAAEHAPNPWPLARRWHWGPVRWPIHWCEAVRAHELDCGALAYLSEVAMREVGLSPLRVQLIQRYPTELTAHWVIRWRAIPGTQDWIWDDLVYHEAVALEASGLLRIWNPTESTWLSPDAGPGRVAALRVLITGRAHESLGHLAWGVHGLEQGAWVRLR